MSVERKKPKSAKRYAYVCDAQITIGNELDEARLTNISASGIQLETSSPMKLNVVLKLLWKDPTLGILSPTMMAVREVHRPEQKHFKYIYGAKYHNLDDQLKKSLVALLQRLRKTEEVEALNKANEINPEFLFGVAQDGLTYLKKVFQNKEVPPAILAKAIEGLADYEKNAFDVDNQMTSILQLSSAQTFQCRVLSLLIPIVLEKPALHVVFLKTVSSILHDIKKTELDIKKVSFEKREDLGEYRSKFLEKFFESRNRTFYAKQELLKKVTSAFRTPSNQTEESSRAMKDITSEYEESFNVTKLSLLDLPVKKIVKKPVSQRTDEMIIDDRVTSYPHAMPIFILSCLALICVLLYHWFW